MQRRHPWLTGLLLVGLCGFAAAILFQVFASARIAAEMTKQWRNGKRLSTAIFKYASAHNDRLPDSDWQSQVERYDPGILSAIEQRDGNQVVGYAALPRVLGKSLNSFDSGTIIFVQYHAPSVRKVIEDSSEVGADSAHWAAFIQSDGSVGHYNRHIVLARLVQQGSFASINR